jgi:hypothetical protein
LFEKTVEIEDSVAHIDGLFSIGEEFIVDVVYERDNKAHIDADPIEELEKIVADKMIHKPARRLPFYWLKE